MVLAHFNKGELAILDKLQGGRTMHKELGIPHYKKLKPLFDDESVLQKVSSMHRATHAAGGISNGISKNIEKAKAGMGRMGDTVRASIPRNMANYMDKLGLSTKNPGTGDREYAGASNFLSNLGNYLPSMSSLNPFGGSSGSDTAASTPTTSAATGSTPGAGGTSMMGSLFNTLAPAVVNAGANYLTGNKGTQNQGQPEPASTPAPAPKKAAAPQQPQNGQQNQGQTPGQYQGQNQNSPGNGSFGGYDPNAPMMQQMQQIMMQHGQRYLGSRNDPYSQFANQMMGRYNQGGAQGLRNNLPQVGYDFANKMSGNRMPQLNFNPYQPQGGMGGGMQGYDPQGGSPYGSQSYPSNGGGYGQQDGGDDGYSDQGYNQPPQPSPRMAQPKSSSMRKPPAMQSSKMKRMPMKKTLSRYR